MKFNLKIIQLWLILNTVLSIPYVLIYGGTDLNENISNGQAKTIIDALTLGAAHRNPGSQDENLKPVNLNDSLNFCSLENTSLIGIPS